MKHLFSLTLVMASFSAFSQPQTIQNAPVLQSESFATTPGTCSIKRFTLATYDLEFLKAFNSIESSRQSLVGATIDTTDPSCIKRYAVVQFIRGCIYSKLVHKKTGEVATYFSPIDSRGKEVPFKFSEWAVDSLDEDPIYNSYSGENQTEETRLDWQQFTKTPLMLRDDRANLLKDYNVFFNAKNFAFSMYANGRIFSQVFITDAPTGSNFMPEIYHDQDEIETSSLDFRTCVYDIKDIPMKGDPASFTEEGKVGGPLKCFSWSDKSKFNEKTRRFDRTSEMDPVCLE